MFNKNVMNIVFYTFGDNYSDKITQVAVFYDDGSVENMSEEDGRTLLKQVMKDRNLTEKDIKNMQNKELYFTMSGSEFEDKFQSFALPVQASRINSDQGDVDYDTDGVLGDFSGKRVKVTKETGIISRVKDFFTVTIPKKLKRRKKSKLFRKATAVVTALAMFFTFGLFSAKNKKVQAATTTPRIISSSVMPMDISQENDEITVSKSDEERVNFENGSCPVQNLINGTDNLVQKGAMTDVALTLKKFNISFADYYMEYNKDIRAGLTFDEIVALQQAYNSYSKDEIRSIFNKAEINAKDLSMAYKNASLQLMGAYIIESKECPVDMSGLIKSQEGKEFYEKYHEMFLACKDATGKEKLSKVKEFYNAVRQDFPISKNDRIYGISHADSYAELAPYKLAVAPMIAAAEMMYQNMEIDYTLNDTEIDFINDLGLCNYAEDTFEKVQAIVLSTCSGDEHNPTYEEYKQAMECKFIDEYGYTDDNRDLSKLDAFVSAINEHTTKSAIVDSSSDIESSRKSNNTSQTHTSTTQKRRSWTEKSTTITGKKTTTHQETIPHEEKKKIDSRIAEENKKKKKVAEVEAEKNRKKIQAIEDQKAKTIEKEVNQDAADLDRMINKANDTINNGGTVKEEDLGHGTSFDKKYVDESGALDKSVTNITTDATGVDNDLPNPSETAGSRFDRSSDVEIIDNPKPSTVPTDECTSSEANNKSEHHESSERHEEHHERSESHEEHHESSENTTTTTTVTTTTVTVETKKDGSGSDKVTDVTEADIAAAKKKKKKKASENPSSKSTDSQVSQKSNEELADEIVESLAQQGAGETEINKVYTYE